MWQRYPTPHTGISRPRSEALRSALRGCQPSQRFGPSGTQPEHGLEVVDGVRSPPCGNQLRAEQLGSEESLWRTDECLEPLLLLRRRRQRPEIPRAIPARLRYERIQDENVDERIGQSGRALCCTAENGVGARDHWRREGR